MFWSVNNAQEKCKYICEIQSKGKKLQEDKKEETKDSKLDNMTYCHDQSEWENLLQKTDCLCDLRKLEQGSVKRKLYQGKCEECLRNQRFLFTTNYKDISKLINVMLKSLKRKQLKKASNSENKKKVKNKQTKKTIPDKGKPAKRKSQLQNPSNPLPTAPKPLQSVALKKSTIQPTLKGKEVIIKTTKASKSIPTPTAENKTLKTHSGPINNSSVTMEAKVAKMNSNLPSDRVLTISNLHPTANSGIHHSKHHHNSPRKCMNLSSTKPLDVIDFSTSQLKSLLQQSRPPPQIVHNPPIYQANFPKKTSPVKIASISPLKQSFINPLINPVEVGQKMFSKNLHFATQTNEKSTKQQLILPKPTLFNQPIQSIASNILKPINVPKPPHDTVVECKQINNPFKKELLLVQVREYLRKHPDAVNYTPSPSVTTQAPCIYLSNGFPQPHQNKRASPLAFRAMLPEHLWKDLINAGIAQHELEEIVLNSNAVKQKVSKKNPTLTASANVQSLVNAFQTTINEAQHNSMNLNTRNILPSPPGNNLNLNCPETLQPPSRNNLVNLYTQNTLQPLAANNLIASNSHNFMQPVPGNKLIKSNPHNTLPSNYSKNLNNQNTLLLAPGNSLLNVDSHNPFKTLLGNSLKNLNPQNVLQPPSRNTLLNASISQTPNNLMTLNPHNIMQPTPDNNLININSLNSSIRALQTIKSNLLLQSNKMTNSTESSLQIAPIAQERIMIGTSSHPSSTILSSNITIDSNIVKTQPVEQQPVKPQFMKSYYNQLVSSTELSSKPSFLAHQGNTFNQQLGKKIFTSKPLPNNFIANLNPSASPKKKNKRIKIATQSDDEQSPHKLVADCKTLQGKTETAVSIKNIQPIKTKTRPSEPTTTSKPAKGKVQQVFETCLDNEIDLNSIVGNEFIEKHFALIDDEDYILEEKKNKKKRNYHELLNEFFAEEEKKAREEEETDLLFVVTNEDGLKIESSSLQGQYFAFL